MSRELGHRPGRQSFGFDCRKVPQLGLAIERRHRDPGLIFPLPADVDAAIARASGVEDMKRLAHFRLEIGDEVVRFERRLQRLMIR